MKIITDNDILQRLLPNTVVTVDGETPLHDKLLPWLSAAEQWVSDQFTGETVLSAIADETWSTIWQQTALLILSDAMRQAIPSLDVVLTPNGYGIVSNQNVAPASKERVERLIESMTAGRDLYADRLLGSLTLREDWQDSSQRARLLESLIQRPLDATSGVYGTRWRGSHWDAFLELRSRAVTIEAAIAQKYTGAALLQRLREALHTPGADGNDRLMARMVLGCVLAELKGEPRDCRTLERVVDYVRTLPEDYPEWASSPVSELWSPPVFRNRRESKGYFF